MSGCTSSSWMVILTSLQIFHGIVSVIQRDERTRTALFTKVGKAYKLSGHVIATHDVTSTLECTQACLATSGCKSYNYQEAGSPRHVCQLNSQTKSSAPSSDYVNQEGFSYYDAEQYAASQCSCQNGGTCQLTSSDYVCQCREDFIGNNCEIWFGFDGLSSSRAGKSCLNIKRSGKDKGDGDYWIDPTRSGSPFLVKCDMTIDGGGWTIVRNSTLDTTTPSGIQEMPDYTSMYELNRYKVIPNNVLLKLRNDMGFNQMRYYCHKKSVGRTVHLMTTMNSFGFDAIRYLLDTKTTPAKACGSFIALPDDTSIISRNCDKLGHYKNNVAYHDRWGNACCYGTNRIYNRVLHYAWESTPRSSLQFTGDSFNCDDDFKNNYQIGDQYILYVR